MQVVTSPVNNGTTALSAGTGSGSQGGGGLSNPNSTAFQTIDLSAHAADIDAGLVDATLDFFVNRNDIYDESSASIEFFDNGSASLGSSFLTLDLGDTGGYIAQSLTATAPTSARSMEITLIADNGTAGSFINVYFDDVSSSLSVVPEPSAFALLAGCFGLTWVMLRRRR